MKRNTKLAAVLAAGATATVGGILAAGPVAAAVGGNGTTSSTTGNYTRMMGGYGGGNTASRSGGASMMGSGGSGYTGMMGSGTNSMMGATGMGMMGSSAITAPSGTLSTAQKATLASVAEQQQLAHDLYQAFAAQYGSVVFDHVATATADQLDTVRTLMTRYDVTDPTAGNVPGTYRDSAVQATYNHLLAQGRGSYDNALAAVRTMAAAQVSQLTNDLGGLTAPDVRQVYNRLLSLSLMYQGMFAQSAN